MIIPRWLKITNKILPKNNFTLQYDDGTGLLRNKYLTHKMIGLASYDIKGKIYLVVNRGKTLGWIPVIGSSKKYHKNGLIKQQYLSKLTTGLKINDRVVKKVKDQYTWI
tara:strand:- start:1560 stop:1886 length:327 start_codon:yes stop_codon:yes gene_type:complete